MSRNGLTGATAFVAFGAMTIASCGSSGERSSVPTTTMSAAASASTIAVSSTGADVPDSVVVDDAGATPLSVEKLITAEQLIAAEVGVDIFPGSTQVADTPQPIAYPCSDEPVFTEAIVSSPGRVVTVDDSLVVRSQLAVLPTQDFSWSPPRLDRKDCVFEHADGGIERVVAVVNERDVANKQDRWIVLWGLELPEEQFVAGSDTYVQKGGLVGVISCAAPGMTMDEASEPCQAAFDRLVENMVAILTAVGATTG